MVDKNNQIINGRIISYDALKKEGSLKAGSVIIPFVLKTNFPYPLGSIVSLKGVLSKNILRVFSFSLIKKPELNFEVWWNKNNKNWQKGVTDPKRIKLLKDKQLLIIITRKFFEKQNFTEVFTPILNSVPGMEPFLDPIKTNSGWLITSPEYNIKKLLISGIGDVFEITKSFRGKEENSPYHNTEFTLLEWYRIFSDYTQIMKDLEQLILALNHSLGKGTVLKFNEHLIDLKSPWPRLKVNDAFKKWVHIDLNKCQNLKDFKKAIKIAKLNIDTTNINDWNDLFYSVFLNYLEPNFPKDKPLIIYDYPLPQGALAKRKFKNSFWTERFEFYLGGVEMGNCFSELTDGNEQELRFKAEQKTRKELGKEIFPLDTDLIEALKIGLPPTSGIAIGLDRLFMLLLGLSDLREYLDFPTNQV
ncbi:MAG: EF-P lysine aminoacylase EpmA, partial [Candidatus Parcubacteria bacterium]|nr:EF-P lysine aminoacylase EpmA [Candidatus Parcubacteria bacterium]